MPVNCHATAITGISIFGKISVGVRRIMTGLKTKISTARTMKVYGRSSATRTIHIIGPLALESRTNRAGHENQMRPYGLLMQQNSRFCVPRSLFLGHRADRMAVLRGVNSSRMLVVLMAILPHLARFRCECPNRQPGPPG